MIVDVVKHDKKHTYFRIVKDEIEVSRIVENSFLENIIKQLEGALEESEKRDLPIHLHLKTDSTDKKDPRRVDITFALYPFEAKELHSKLQNGFYPKRYTFTKADIEFLHGANIKQ